MCGNLKCENRGKHPRIRAWPEKATTDPEQLERWFGKNDSNIGIVTGSVSGLLVLDIDPASGGMKSLNVLISIHGKLPNTERTRTGGGGAHLYYRLPGSVQIKNSVCRLGAGLDIRADRGYVVAPPSITDALYQWNNQLPRAGELAEAPQWLLDLLTMKRTVDPMKIVRLNDDLTGPPSEEFIESPQHVQRVESALSHINPDPYDAWLKVGMALHSTGWGDCAKRLWDRWSEQSEKFDAASQDRTWNSFGVTDGEAITIGTVFYLAREAGWVAGGASPASGDVANAQLFAAMYCGKMRFVYPAGKWMKWDSRRWIWCDAGEALQAAKKVAIRLLDDAGNRWKAEPDTPASKRALVHATKSQQLNRLEAMLKLAASEKEIAIGAMSALDADPWLLGVRNGVVDLRTGALLDPHPEQFITRQCRAALISNAHCPRWKRFLSEVFQGDEAQIAYTQRALGYTITGLVREEVLFFMYGHGANGKSVLANVICEVIGDYAQMAPSDLLTLRNENGAARSDVARMAGARLVMANETQNGDRMNERLVKTLVSRETITARFLYQDLFEYSPTHKLWVRGNHKPIITGDDDGIWRRIHLIPFERKFEEHERDADLESKLLEERDGILAWMVEGARLWHQHGLNPPTAVIRASAEYRQQSDILGEWLDNECAREPGREVDQQVAYEAYGRWCRDNGLRPLSKKQFTSKLFERGCGERRGHRGRFYTGLALRSPWSVQGAQDARD
jgi:P4 family phage/plasmid primase-like protien